MKKTEISKSFYFIYVVVGPTYINSLLSQLKKSPSNANVVILTNTPELVKNTNIPCNLIVDNIENYMSEFDKKKEFILKIYDADEYDIELSKLYNGNKDNVESGNGYRFPHTIVRHAIKWCVDNDITNFIICDYGCVINHDFDKILNDITDAFNDKYDNIIGAHPNYIHDEDSSFYDRFRNITPYINETIERENIELEKISPKFTWAAGLPEEYHVTKRGEINMDGFCTLYLFKDKDLLHKFYRIYNDIVRQLYKDRPDALDFKNLENYDGYFSNKNTVISDDEVENIVIELFAKYYGVLITTIYLLINHFYRYDNDAYLMGKIRFNDFPWIQTKTRKEFLEKNKELLMYKYGPVLIEIFGLEEDFNIPNNFDWENFNIYAQKKYNIK